MEIFLINEYMIFRRQDKTVEHEEEESQPKKSARKEALEVK
jgi:hypothetical protein